MVGRLQYSSTGSAGTYNDIATIRPLNGRDYKVTSVKGKNRNDNVEVLCYKIKVKAKFRSLPSTFLNNDQYYFRIYYNSKVYECTASHTSGSGVNEPEYDIWENFWDIITMGRGSLPTWQNSHSYYDSYEIALGQRYFTYDFNPVLKIQDIHSHQIEIEFTCNPDDVTDYTELVGVA